MISRKAYAKVNLCLDVLRRRDDGYHEVKMIMQTVDIYDTLTFAINENMPRCKSADADNQITLQILGVPANADLGPIEKNLIYKSARLILDTYDIKTNVTITLEKHIPVAAGMAGGSTDAAAVFHGLNELLDLKMSLEDMMKLGVKIGADVPYCIMGGTALAEGIGEILSPLPNPPECYLLIVKPDINVSTKFVYENLHVETRTEHPPVDTAIQALSNHDLTLLINSLGNILETVTIPEYPIIDRIKVLMTESGALGSLMSGSGPTVFGIFDEKAKAESAAILLRESKISDEIFVTDWVNEIN